MSRRAFVGTLAAVPLVAADDVWVDLFDGRSLQGWRPSENKNSWKVEAGRSRRRSPVPPLLLRPRSRRKLPEFRTGSGGQCGPRRQLRSLFPHRLSGKRVSPKGLRNPDQQHRTGEGAYRERKKTGSLYGLRNVYKQLAARQRVVQNPRCGARQEHPDPASTACCVVDYVEPTPPVIPAGRSASASSIAAHSRCSATTTDRGCASAACACVRCRTTTHTPGDAPVVDDTFRRSSTPAATTSRWWIIHVHLKGADARAGAGEIAPRRHPVRNRGELRQGLPSETMPACGTSSIACEASPSSWPCRPRAGNGRRCSPARRSRSSTTSSPIP